MHCQYCSNERKNRRGLSQHEIYCSANPNRKFRVNGMLGKKGSNQFIKNPGTKHSSATRMKLSKAAVHQKWSDERRKKLSDIAKSKNLGGHTSKNKIYFVKKNGEAVYLQSSYETRMAEILERLDIEWSRPDPLSWVDDNGEHHRYYPDFKIGSIYLDTKNDYLIRKDASKINAVRTQNSVKLLVVSKDEITEEYVNALKALW